MTEQEIDKFFQDIIDACIESESCGSIEIPREILESDELFLNWLDSL